MDRFYRFLVRIGLKKPNMTVSAKVFRADGTVEDLGVISRGYTRFKGKKE